LPNGESARQKRHHRLLEAVSKSAATLGGLLEPGIAEGGVAGQALLPGGSAEDVPAVATNGGAQVRRCAVGDEAAEVPEAAYELGV
jgi:hypothetical protein